mmetsp:Transcript_2517/g.2910  ORF Transcript_2517/g.2910 Transcript_2517/m.2910 type:complete len:158 (+) Transcript_2517:260-733(+)
MIHGLSPSPRIEMKYFSQEKDPINGKDFVSRSFGPNAAQQHKHFQRYFGVQNPVTVSPPKYTEPNWKIKELLDCMICISIEAWDCGKFISVDEQKIRFQGSRSDKLQITYKIKGNGFQCDALCNDGFTYCLYFCNQRSPKKNQPGPLSITRTSYVPI